MLQVRSLKTGIKFKDTPIGKIPVDWEVTQLENICEVIGGNTPSTTNKENWNGNILWATPTDITALKGRTIDETKKQISEKGLSSCGANLLPEGTILMTSRATIGACAINTKQMATNQGFASLACKERVFNWFIYYLVSLYHKELERLGSGSTFREVSKKSVKSWYLPLPPLPEQKKIAEILSNVDDAIEETDRIIEKTKELKKGLMQKLLTRGIGHEKFKKTEIGEIPYGWEIKALNDVADIIDCKHRTPKYKVDYEDYLDLIENHKPRINDIVYSRNASFGVASIVANNDKPFAIGQDVCMISGKDLKGLFLFYVLNSLIIKKQLVKLSAGSTFKRINLKDIRNFKVPFLPIKEQSEIAKILFSIDLELGNEEKHKHELETLKKSLMQVLLTGKIRVKVG